MPDPSDPTTNILRAHQGEFPRSAGYDLDLAMDHAMGPNVLWLAEWLCDPLGLEPGMRVLDLGCGKALSSIFLAKEYGVRVWATDLWIDPHSNWKRIEAADVGHLVCPVHAEAHDLPYAHGFFDVVVSLDSYQYYGTDNLYLPYLVRFLKPAGILATASVGLTKEFPLEIPPDLGPQWDPELRCFHDLEWWKRHFDGSGLVRVEHAENHPHGWALWKEWEEAIARAGKSPYPMDPGFFTEATREYFTLQKLVARAHRPPTPA
jgi:cyclopropane fatty-acyl-phospholipid synthase-like methyltransferase